MKLTAKVDTLLKLYPVPGSQLKDSDKVAIANGFSKQIHSVDPDDDQGHLRVAFKEPVLGNRNTVWVFSGHVVFEGTSYAIESVKPKFDGKIDWHNPSCMISEYFSVLEVTKNDPRRIPVAGSQVAKNAVRLAKELDIIRKEWGHPLSVTSWNRPERVNRECGGASQSEHKEGSAADVFPLAGGNIWQFQSWLDKRWKFALGLGAERGFVHCGLRSLRRWKY